MNNIAANDATPVAAYSPAAASTGSSSSSLGASNVGNTFLSLLVKELQNQDPTAPMDSTAMVGQMISLNQLEQLTSINQAVGGSSTSSGAPKANASHAAAAPVASTPAVAANQLPFDLNTMMPVGPGSDNAAALAASINPSLNAASMGALGYSNNVSGGK